MARELGVDRPLVGPGGCETRLAELEEAGKILVGNNPSTGYRVTITPMGPGEIITIGVSRRALGRMINVEIAYEKNGGRHIG